MQEQIAQALSDRAPHKRPSRGSRRPVLQLLSFSSLVSASHRSDAFLPCCRSRGCSMRAHLLTRYKRVLTMSPPSSGLYARASCRPVGALSSSPLPCTPLLDDGAVRYARLASVSDPTLSLQQRRIGDCAASWVTSAPSPFRPILACWTRIYSQRLDTITSWGALVRYARIYAARPLRTITHGLL